MRKRLLVSLLFAASAGCASAEKGEPASAAPAPVSSEGEGAVVTALSDSAIPKGACGMVLWTLDDERPTPIFRYLVGKGALMVLNGKETKFALAEAAGSSSFGVSERQKFTNDDGLAVSVESRFSLGFDGGSYLERGVISIVTAGGWKTVVPAAGLAGCRS